MGFVGMAIIAASLQNKFSVSFTINSFPPEQNGLHFADDIFKCIFVNENACILIEISLNFVPKGSIDNKPALV